MVKSIFALLTIDFHAPNYLITLQSIPTTITELLMKDNAAKSMNSPETDYVEYTNAATGQKNKIYRSQSLDLILDGEVFCLDDIIVKITDFGKGKNTIIIMLIYCLLRRGR
jgi:hypothetical protein